jgi:hypothetical protein
MKIKKILLDTVVTFVITLVVAIVVTLLWNLIVEKKGAIVDWRISFTMALVMGIVLPSARSRIR